jgi:hypothetical protein
MVHLLNDSINVFMFVKISVNQTVGQCSEQCQIEGKFIDQNIMAKKQMSIAEGGCCTSRQVYIYS